MAKHTDTDRSLVVVVVVVNPARAMRGPKSEEGGVVMDCLTSYGLMDYGPRTIDRSRHDVELGATATSHSSHQCIAYVRHSHRR